MDHHGRARCPHEQGPKANRLKRSQSAASRYSGSENKIGPFGQGVKLLTSSSRNTREACAKPERKYRGFVCRTDEKFIRAIFHLFGPGEFNSGKICMVGRKNFLRERATERMQKLQLVDFVVFLSGPSGGISFAHLRDV
jgi:hypothetical protein